MGSQVGPPPSDYERYVVQLRKQFGLESGLERVRGIEAGVSHRAGLTERSNGRASVLDLDQIYEPLGIAMTPGEVASMKRRDSRVDASAKYNQLFERSPYFAGSWIDQAAGGVLHAAFTRRPTKSVDEMLASLAPSGESPTVDIVPHSLNELNEVLSQVTGKQHEAVAQGNYTVGQSAWVDVPTNTILVGIPDFVSDDAGTSLVREYGAIISLRREPLARMAGSRDLPNAPASGGKRIKNTTTGLLCTIGTARFRNSLGQLYGITAGHCAANGQIFVLTRPDGTYGPGIGATHASSAGEKYITCDCLAVGPLSASMTTSSYLGNGNQVQYFTSAGPPTTGQAVCQDGAASFEALGGRLRCGTYLGTGTVSYPNGQTLSPAFRMNATGLGGDSGAPVIEASGGTPLTKWSGS